MNDLNLNYFLFRSSSVCQGWTGWMGWSKMPIQGEQLYYSARLRNAEDTSRKVIKQLGNTSSRGGQFV